MHAQRIRRLAASTFARVLEAAVDDGAEQLGLEKEVAEAGRVDTDVVTPVRGVQRAATVRCAEAELQMGWGQAWRDAPAAQGAERRQRCAGPDPPGHPGYSRVLEATQQASRIGSLLAVLGCLDLAGRLLYRLHGRILVVEKLLLQVAHGEEAARWDSRARGCREGLFDELARAAAPGGPKADATRDSVASTVAEVCAWAGRDSTRGGAGLDGDDIAILRREKIEGDSLFALTDAELKDVGLPLGTRKRLLAAVALLPVRAGDLDVIAFVVVIA